jgi:hypothetical protein
MPPYCKRVVNGWLRAPSAGRVHNPAWKVHGVPLDDWVMIPAVQSALMPANLTTLAHFLVSSAIGLPSAGARTTASAPIFPAAPDRLSIRKFCPMRSDSQWPIKRAVMSLTPADDETHQPGRTGLRPCDARESGEGGGNPPPDAENLDAEVSQLARIGRPIEIAQSGAPMTARRPARRGAKIRVLVAVSADAADRRHALRLAGVIAGCRAAHAPSEVPGAPWIAGRRLRRCRVDFAEQRRSDQDEGEH